MQCEQARQTLSERRYGGADSAAATSTALDAHLRDCADCRRFRNLDDQLDTALSLHTAPPPRPGFDTRFFARLDEERRGHHRRNRMRLWWALLPIGAAAALALLVPHPDRPVDPARQAASEPRAKPNAAPEPQGEALSTVSTDIELALDLELVEELSVIENLDEVEAYEVLSMVDAAELDRIVAEVAP